MLLSFPFLNPNYTDSIDAERSNPPSKYLRPNVPPAYAEVYKKQHEILLRTHSNPLAPADESTAGSLALLLRPLSRGYIRPRTSNILDEVIMNWRTLTNPLDMEILLSSIKFSRRFFQSETMKQFSPREVQPGPGVVSDEDLIAFIRRSASPSNAHTCCTLSLGAASDARARLKGVKGVRIADASVWPFVPGAHATQQTAYVVAEKVADLVKEDWEGM